MDPTSILVPVLIIVIIVFVVALVLMVLKLMKTVDIANETIVDLKAQLDPTLENVKIITTDIQPTVRKLEPVVDRVQLTLDAVNLEMMRVDEILEDVAQITDSASSASAAVDKISNAPVKAVSGVASKMREKFTSKNASAESAQIADQRSAVEQALEEYKAVAAVEVAESAEEEIVAKHKKADGFALEPDPVFDSKPEGQKPYMVIDPMALETSPFFEDAPDGR